MTTALNTKSLYEPLPTDKPPITVDSSTTIQRLSSDLKDYDLTLELTTKNILIDFFSYGAVLHAVEPFTDSEHRQKKINTANHADGATVVANILAGQIPLAEAACLVEKLGDRHQVKVEFMKKAQTVTSGDKTILKNGFTINQTRHSFSVEDIHKLAEMLRL